MHCSVHARRSCPRRSESRMWKLRLHYGDFVQANSNMADKTASQLQSITLVSGPIKRFLILGAV